MSLLVGVDLGKTECRVRLLADGRLQQIVRGGGAPGLAEPDGAAGAVEAVVATVTRALHTVGPDTAMEAITVGAAGAEAAPDAAVSFASVLGHRLGVTAVAVASDALVSHVGAFGGAAGVALSVGTGAVAVGVSASGQLVRVDGSGPWLGDDGSGAWIGREALRAALREREQRGPATVLTEAAEQRYGDLAALTQTVARQGQVARDTAAFVPDVVRCALAGDAQAADILQRAALALAATTMAAVRRVDVPLVCVVGGLAAAEPLMEAWRKALDDAVDVVAPRGTALDGALVLAARRDLPHESNVQRLGLTSGVETVTAVAVDDVDALETERVRPDLHDLDTRSPEELVDLLLEAEASVPRAVAAARAELADAVRLLAAAFDSGGRLVYVGAGTPGRLAAVDAAECPPTFGTSPDQVIAVLAGGQQAAIDAVEGAEDDAAAGAADVDGVHLTPADVVVGITASGRTPYVLGALESARRSGAKTIAVVNNSGSAAADLADLTIELLTGPEVLSGSTRLKAGTSEKITLNALSTSAMILTGKSYGAWMVDVRASNEKLRRRARRIIRQATGVGDAEAIRVLELCDWHTKLALVSILGECDVEAARSRLDAARGRVRGAIRGQQAR
jgi:N-acetylmuramic acid 6-phosphate etherase